MSTRQQHLQQLSQLMRATTWQSYRQGMASMEQLGLTIPQAIMLLALQAQAGRATMRDLAQLTQQANATITGMTDRLSDVGMVRRERDRADRRLVYVVLTEAGREKLAAINAQRDQEMEQLMATFSDAEVQLLLQLMEKFSALIAPQAE